MAKLAGTRLPKTLRGLCDLSCLWDTQDGVFLCPLTRHADASVKAGQVKKLGMLLEALEPLPGLDPDKLLDVMEGAKPEHEIDFRDAKASARVAPWASSRAATPPAGAPA